MTFMFHQGNVRCPAALFGLLKSRLGSLARRQPIAAVRGAIERRPEAYPPYYAAIVVRGPEADVQTAALGSTAEIAARRALAAVEEGASAERRCRQPLRQQAETGAGRRAGLVREVAR